MLPIANILLLVLNAIFLVSLFTAPVPAPTKQVPVESNNDEIIELIADLKSEIATMQQRQPMMQSKVEYIREPEEDNKLSAVCIAYQIHMRSGNHFWTYIDTNTGKPLFCTPNNIKTKIPTIDVDPLPQEFREDLIEQ